MKNVDIQAAGRDRPGGGAMELFWGNLVPFTVLASVGAALVPATAAVVAVAATWSQAALLAALGLAAQLLLLLPLEYYLVRNRVRLPIACLAGELRGCLPWRPERDPLLGSVRGILDDVRATAAQAVEDAARQHELLVDLRARAEDRRSAEALVERLTDALRGADPLDEYMAAVSAVLREAWPFEHLRLLTRTTPDSGMQVRYAEDEGSAGGVPPTPLLYRHASLPHPVKEALHRGFFCESAIPFTRDSALPAARSFVALALEHRGFAAGVLLLASSTLTPPSAEPLRQLRALLSLGFSRALFHGEVADAAIRDSLTGVFTEQHFLSCVRDELARSNRYGRPAACLLFDIDELGRTNELHGSRAGDQVIVEVAHVVDRLIRTTDTLARIAGGEFALLLPETTADAAALVAERIRERVQEHSVVLPPGDKVDRVTVSVGIGAHPPQGITALALVDAARSALRLAKGSGKNRVKRPSPVG